MTYTSRHTLSSEADMWVLHTRERLCVTGESVQHKEGLFKVHVSLRQEQGYVSVRQDEVCVSVSQEEVFIYSACVKKGCRECVKEG